MIDIDKLDRDDLIIVTTAMREGSSYEEAIANLIPKKTIELIDSLHSLLCKDNHNEDGSCTYYNELVSGPSHKNWLTELNTLRNSYNDIENIDNILSEVIQYVWRVENIRFEVEKEVAVGGTSLFNYLLTKLI